MPTAARLFAAFAFALIACLAAGAWQQGLPSRPAFSGTLLLAGPAVIGLLGGWLVMGRLAGAGVVRAMSGGLRTSALVAFFSLMLFSGGEMLGRALKRRYDGVFEALLGMVEIFLYHGQMLLQPAPLTVLILGGFAGGLLAEWAARRWS